MKRYLSAFNLLLTTAMVYFSVNAFYKTAVFELGDFPVPTAVNKPVSDPETEKSHPPSYYKAIVDRNLFDTMAKAVEKPKPVDVETLKPTELKLTLLGTVTGEKDGAYAVIEEAKGKKQNLYRIGDTIQTAKIENILRERVILVVNGKREVLAMEEIRNRKAKMSASRAPQPSFSPSNPTPSTRRINLKSTQVQGAVNNLNDLMRQARIRPHFFNGK